MVTMQSYTTQDPVGHGSNLASGGQYAPNHFVSVPTQNRFAPLNEWVGYSMGVEEPEQMELQWVPARNKRRRCNTGSPGTGTGQNNFSSLDMDEKLSHIVDKLNGLEQSNREIMKFGQQMSSLQSKIDKTEQRTVNHELLLKVLAYKSIDIEARSRRCNLVIHGLAESKNERLSEILHEFMWSELGIDSDDLYIDRFHRLGSLHKAKQRQRTDNPRRPIIIAFSDYSNIERILGTVYMLKGTGYSVTKDYPKEIVAARQRLMPLFKSERQNRNNKVSIEYPARLVVNGRVIADEFPDWYQVLEHDRYKLACGDYSPQIDRPQQNDHLVPPRHIRPSNHDVYSGTSNVGDRPGSPVRTYAHVASSVNQQQSNGQPINPLTRASTSNSASAPGPANVPRYTAPNSENQGRGYGSSRTADNTTNLSQNSTYNTTVNNSPSSTNRNTNGALSRDTPTYTNLD